MPDLDERDRKALRERLKGFGPARVRSMLDRDQFPTGMVREIENWLSEAEASAAKPDRESAAESRRNKPSPECERVLGEIKAKSLAELKKIIKTQDSGAEEFKTSRGTFCKAFAIFLGFDVNNKPPPSWQVMLAVLANVKITRKS